MIIIKNNSSRLYTFQNKNILPGKDVKVKDSDIKPHILKSFKKNPELDVYEVPDEKPEEPAKPAPKKRGRKPKAKLVIKDVEIEDQEIKPVDIKTDTPESQE